MRIKVKDLIFKPHFHVPQWYEHCYVELKRGRFLSVCKRIKGADLFHPRDKTKYEVALLKGDEKLGEINAIYFQTNKELQKYIDELISS